MRARKLDLQRKIKEIENPYPPDDFILSYRDYLSVRHTLPAYQFNPKVFHQLLSLLVEVWDSPKRVNRLGLLHSTICYLNLLRRTYEKDFYNRTLIPTVDLPLVTRLLIFEVFKNVYTRSSYLPFKQTQKAQSLATLLMINIPLSTEVEQWLCDHAGWSERILNRVLRYPKQSSVITAWAKSVYPSPTYAHRRAELASWIIDEVPTFEISKFTLVQDFQWLNEQDQTAIETYCKELAAQQLVQRELDTKLSQPELKLHKRPYRIIKKIVKPFNIVIPDFKATSELFFEQLNNHHEVSMMWAIANSRLPESEKTKLMPKHYSLETHQYMVRIARQARLLEVLKWMLQQVEKNEQSLKPRKTK